MGVTWTGLAVRLGWRDGALRVCFYWNGMVD